MTTRIDQRENIVQALKRFESVPLAEAACNLFSCLGYSSSRTLPISTTAEFFEQLAAHTDFTERQRESLESLESLHLLFQLTDAELSQQMEMFDDRSAVKDSLIESYLFFAAELPPGHYTRTDISNIVRALNKPLKMPALLLIRHGETISLAIVHRRLHKRDASRDVLEKVTLIKDINFSAPIRAHIDILNEFTFTSLAADYGVADFTSLHNAWQKRLDTYALSKNFYREIADWYFWAQHLVEDGTIKLPRDCDTEREKSLFLIRLLTRLIFCWFLVEKRLIPPELFRQYPLRKLLRALTPDDSSYYHAVLQNLFFGTLNMPREQREFRGKKKEGQRYDRNFGSTNLWRHEDQFRNPADWIELAEHIPFLNGGLFDCLDDKTSPKEEQFIRDGFSDNENLSCHLPNDLFFGSNRHVDLSRDYGEEKRRTARSQRAEVRGLVEILSRYKFTIEENTPLEQEIALDPELLGKVFENLLASYNEDTRSTARKALGAYYTPREIVGYIVDQSLKYYLASRVPRSEKLLDELFSGNAPPADMSSEISDALITAIGDVKVLDPACGSGAFLMGALHRLVDLLQKLDPNNESWKRDRLAEARRYLDTLSQSGAPSDELEACEDRIADIEKSFNSRYHALDFARKLYLVENCIYGVDIEPIAVQIAKLRFFIALIVDQKVDISEPNLNVRPLPNLETRLVAANTLIALPEVKKRQANLFDDDSEAFHQHKQLKTELQRIRHEHFNARSPRRKRHWRAEDKRVRSELGKLLKHIGVPDRAAEAMAQWDPYDQNSSASFFDPEWMFALAAGKNNNATENSTTLTGKFSIINDTPGQTELTAKSNDGNNNGFDIVIGNPPYLSLQKLRGTSVQSEYRNQAYAAHDSNGDLYCLFYEKGLDLLRDGGILALITSNKWLRAGYGRKLRQLLTDYNPRILIDLGPGVFSSATVDTNILIVSKERNRKQLKAANLAKIKSENPDLSSLLKEHGVTLSELGQETWFIGGDAELRLKKKIEEIGVPLKDWDVKINYGIKTGLDDAFIIDTDTRDILVAEDPKSAEIIKPILRGRDIKRYSYNWAGLWLIFIPWHFPLHENHAINGASELAESEFQKQYRAIYNHLLKYKNNLAKRNPAETGRRYEWYALQRCAATYYSEFEKEKLVWAGVGNKRFEIALAPKGFFLKEPANLMTGKKIKYLLGLIHSLPVGFFYDQIKTEVGKGTRFYVRDFIEIPLPAIISDNQQKVEKKIEQTVDQILAAKEEDSTADTSDLEKHIDQLVYQLYDLTPEEIEIVENSTK